MFTFIVIIHVLICAFLIVAILMQSGRGGGLSEAFGGGSSSGAGGTMGSLFGTESTTIMTKITIGLAIGFFVTSLLITIIGRQKGVSLMEKADVQEKEEETKEEKGKEEESEIPLGPQQQGMPLK